MPKEARLGTEQGILRAVLPTPNPETILNEDHIPPTRGCSLFDPSNLPTRQLEKPVVTTEDVQKAGLGVGLPSGQEGFGGEYLSV